MHRHSHSDYITGNVRELRYTTRLLYDSSQAAFDLTSVNSWTYTANDSGS